MLTERMLHYLQQDQYIGELALASDVIKVYVGQPEGDCAVFSMQHCAGRIKTLCFLAQGGPSLIAGCAYVAEQLVGQELECLKAIDSTVLLQYFSLAKTEISKAVLIEEALQQLYRAAN